MSTTSWKSSLSPKDKSLQLSKGSLSDDFDEFLSEFYFKENYEISILSAEVLNPKDPEKTQIDGKSCFLNIPNLPLQASFAQDSEGKMKSYFEYTLTDATKGPDYWTFFKSFPKMPHAQGSDEEQLSNALSSQTPSLHDLAFDEAKVIVSSYAFTHQSYGIELERGINFIGKLRPTVSLGLIAKLLQKQESLIVHGRIVLPKNDTAVTLPQEAFDLKKRFYYPWEGPRQVPGIHLQADVQWGHKIGGAEVKEASFRLYSPTEKDWIYKSETFQPLLGFTGRLLLPSSDQSIQFVARNVPKTSGIFVESRLEGFSLDNLAHLSSLSGDDHLERKFPSEFSSVLKTAAKLELTELCFSLGIEDSGPILNSCSFDIALPNGDWKIWKDKVVMKEIDARVEIDSPLSRRPQLFAKVMGTVSLGGYDVDITASNSGGWKVMAALHSEQDLSLKEILKSLIPNLKAPADFSVDHLLLTIMPGESLALSGAVAQNSPWSFEIANEQVQISDVLFYLGTSSNGDLNGEFRGVAKFGNFELDVLYKIPGDFVVRSTCKKISFKDLQKKIVKGTKILPPAFNPEITNASLLIKRENQEMVLQVGGTLKKDSFVFEGKKIQSEGGGWGFAAGVSMDEPKLSSLPGLEALAPLEKRVKMKNITLVAGSYASKEFRFPSLAAFNNPAMTTQKMPLPASSGGLQKGLNFYASWEVDTSKKDMKLLKKFLGLNPSVDVTLQVSPKVTDASRLFLSYDCKVNKTWPLSCQLGFALNNKTPEFFLVGHLVAKVQKQPCTFDVAMSFVKTGMYVSGNMEGTVRFDHLQISNLALMLGMNWGGIPSIGIAGSLDFSKVSGSIALLFDANDPSRSLLAGSLSDLTLKDVLVELAGVKKLPKEIGAPLKKIGLEGTKPFLIPNQASAALDELDLTKVSQAFSQNGSIQIGTSQEQVLIVVREKGKSWQLTDLSNNMMHYHLEKTLRGIRVTLDSQIYLAPQATQIGTMRFSQGFFLNGTLNILGLKWTSTVNISKRKGICVDTYLNKKLVVCNPQFLSVSDLSGKRGPRLSLSTYNQPKHEVKEFRKPHIYLNGKLAFLGLQATSFIEINSKGATLYLEQQRTLKLGSRAISASVDAGYKITITMDSIAQLDACGSSHIKINGKIHVGKIPFLKKAIPGSAIKNLGKVSINLSVRAKLDIGYNKKKEYAKMFATFKFMGTNFTVNAKLNVKNKALLNVGDVVFDEIKGGLGSLFKDASKWAKLVKQGVIEEVKSIEQVAKVLKDVYGKAAKDAAKIMKDVGHGFDDLGKAMKNVFKLNEKDVAKSLKTLGADANKIAGALKKSFKADAKKVAKALKGAGFSTEKVGGVLKSVFKTPGKDVAKVFQSIGIGSKDTAKVLKKTFRMNAKDVGGCLKSTFKVSDKEMKTLLKGAGYATKEVDKAFKSLGKSIKKIFKF